MLDALRTAGNPGRGAHEPTLHASRLVYAARCAVSRLLNAPDPSCVAFTANATQALNTALGGLFAPGDHIITTVCEHNSVLRALYRLRDQEGVQRSVLPGWTRKDACNMTAGRSSSSPIQRRSCCGCFQCDGQWHRPCPGLRVCTPERPASDCGCCSDSRGSACRCTGTGH